MLCDTAGREMSHEASSDTIASSYDIGMSSSKFRIEHFSANQLVAPAHVVDTESQAAPPVVNLAYINQPDGGLVAWLQVIGSFILFFNTWGAMNTFGVFQTYYESGALFNESSSNIAWIGSIQSFCLQVMGLFAGPVYDRGGFRILIIVGSCGVVLGYMLLSLVSRRVKSHSEFG
jgi:hypothetical protein